MERFGRIGMVARWRPVHNGQAPVLRALCERADEALVGVGSSNRYDLRNPFTFEETAEMIRRVLPGRDALRILPVPDLDDGPRWREMVRGLFGDLDLFVTDNPYVAHLMGDLYRVERPVALVPVGERVPLEGTAVRLAMARGDGWREMVPSEVADFIAAGKLDERFRREFGLQALAGAVWPQPRPRP